MIYVLDFGSQYTQLIAKKLRYLGFAAEVHPGNISAATLKAQSLRPKGIIFSGSPASVGTGHDPDAEILSLGIPVLGLCFGYQFLAHHFGGKVEASAHREYGSATVAKTADGRLDLLTQGLGDTSAVWMSHGDSVTELPPNSQLLLSSGGKPAAFRMRDKPIWALQFHPEVHHTPEGAKILESFARNVCGSAEDWNLKVSLESVKAQLAEKLKGVSEIYCAVSGGVDSTVLAVLLSEVVQVNALYVDHGFQRDYDLSDLKRAFSNHPNIHLKVIDAADQFWGELEGVSDPEKKRKVMGKLFMDVFFAHVPRPSAKEEVFLSQGTIYSDVIESAQNKLAASHKIKSHHNVGGLPENLPFTLVEPLRNFFKDEVRDIGRLLKIPQENLARHPFPGPGLSIRCVGALTRERIDVLREADRILHDTLVEKGLYASTWQALCVLLPISTVGVMGDGRTYESVLAIRAVDSLDAMTAEASSFPWADLKDLSSRIVNQVRGINRVVYDLTSKPPGTIEWE